MLDPPPPRFFPKGALLLYLFGPLCARFGPGLYPLWYWFGPGFLAGPCSSIPATIAVSSTSLLCPLREHLFFLPTSNPSQVVKLPNEVGYRHEEGDASKAE